MRCGGADPILLRNIRVLGGGRRPQFVDEDAVVKVDAAAQSGMTIAEVEQASGVDRRDARAAVLRLLWMTSGVVGRRSSMAMWRGEASWRMHRSGLEDHRNCLRGEPRDASPGGPITRGTCLPFS